VVTPDERRLVTVLMGDLVGFTTMAAAADPEQVKRLVDHCFERLVADVTAFGGRLDKIVGDEIIALFGAPVAHEDDAERAVRAALRIHETIAGMRPDLAVPVSMRIGINTGEVLVGAMRAGGDATAMGDVVNTAQRLETMAEPGQVIVGPATYAATRNAIRYESLGLIALKGRDEPVEAFKAEEALAPPGRRVRERVPLVGRDAELGAFRHTLQMTTSRHRAHLVLLIGDAGVGKSRLASEIGTVAASEFGARVLSGQCVPYGDANVFGPVAEALRHACGIDGMTRDGEARTRVVETVTAMLGLNAEATETERITEGLIYVMEGVTRPGVDPSRARDDALRSALAFFEALASRSPLVIVLSDLHWADDEVLELCDRLLARLRNHPLVLVATARPGLETRWAPEASKHNTLALQVDPLDDDATAELVRSLFCGDVDDETVAFLLERSGGNPFFVEELVAFVRDTPQDDRMRELPATLHGLLAARLDALDPAERSVLEDCAVVGGSGPLAVVASASGRVDAKRVFERLAERDLLRLEGDDYHFKSELVREIAYGTLTKAERARRHAALAPVLAARGEVAIDQVAHHLATAAELVMEIGPAPGVPTDVQAQAVEALIRAAERDEAVESWLQSGRHYDRALALLAPEDGQARRRALLGRARAKVEQRRLDEARSDVLTVLDEARAAGDRPSEAAAVTLLAESEAAAGAYDAAEVTFSDALSMWRELRDDSGAAHVLRGLGMSHLFRGDLVQAERFVSEALASYRSSGNQRGEAWAQQNLAWIAFSHGDISTAEHRLQHSADLFGALGDWGGLGWAYGLLAFVRFSQGRLDEAAAIAEQIAEEGRDTGNRWAVGMMEELQASVALWRGRTHEALERGRAAMRTFQELGDWWGELMSGGPVVRALSELGREADYQASLAHLYDVARSAPDEAMRLMPAVLEACSDLQRGDAEHAMSVLGRVELRDARELGGADLHAAHGLALTQLGRDQEAIAVLEPCYRDAEHDGPAMVLGSRLALAYAVAHREDDALDVVEQLQTRSGGTYSDRMFALWAESLARARRGEREARAGADAAHAIATTTDAALEHSIAALARAKVLAALGDDDASAAAEDATRQLDTLAMTAEGWHRLFDQALEGVLPV
jgi:class 3 adenylate cyclase/tetratricopeptide (TPR) repeat protein